VVHALLIGLCISAGECGTDTEHKAPAIGAAVPDFSLRDIHRRTRSLDQFKDKKAFVIVFVGTECPLANLYIPTLVDMHNEYSERGVQFVAINANAQDKFVEVSAHAQERSVPFPVLKDFDQSVADSFGAKRTPEAFLLDGERVIRYHGRIDDQYGIGYHRDSPTTTDLKNALDEVLAGKAVSKPESELPGCVIARARKPRVKEEVTYARDISRIVQNRCQRCHRPGEIGPMPLLTYDDAKQWAETIHEVVLEQRMPPWHPDPRFGKFSNDRRLTERESETLLAWVEQGCPQGSDDDLPAPKEFVEGWVIGQPDLVVEMPEEFAVPATGVVPYKRFVVDPGFTEDKWFQAAEARPGNRAVVHHIIVYVQVPGKPLYQRDGTASILSGWAPGDLPHVYPSGTAKRIPAGSKFVFEMHYTPNGTAQSDRSRVGIRFAAEPPQKVAETNILANILFKIPPGSPRHEAQLTYTFRDDAQLLGFMPHMHLRGLSARYELTRPDGSRETLLSVPDYDFNWQSVYRFAEPIRVVKGSQLTWTGVWDNSPDNPRNPDATREVRWGEQTWDEMMNGWMDLVWDKSP
jgi:peroxiredoxin/mono/diheme cytochrome c family protein